MVALLTMELDHEELMLNVLKELLPSLVRFSNKQLVQKYGKEKTEEALSLLIDYVINSCGKNLSRNEIEALYLRIIRCLVDYLKYQLKIPVTLNTVLSNFPQIDFAVNCEFPGYAESGFLKAIVSPKNLHEIELEKAS